MEGGRCSRPRWRLVGPCQRLLRAGWCRARPPAGEGAGGPERLSLSSGKGVGSVGVRSSHPHFHRTRDGEGDRLVMTVTMKTTTIIMAPELRVCPFSAPDLHTLV